MDWQEVFSSGMAYSDFLDSYGSSEHQSRWNRVYDQVSLAAEQKSLLRDFTRRMHVVCLAGAWCGDCVNQCPILQHFAEANDHIVLRFFDRDDAEAVRNAVKICGGNRVPSVVFLSEDFDECGRYGDRTLSKYREMSQKLTGAACPTGIGAQDETLLQSVVREWLVEFERIQWMLRLSPRLREKHND